ncbi:MAG: hypothetical protein ACJAYY_000734 [Paraglaciecola sp.]|jgi:hypothetical protein
MMVLFYKAAPLKELHGNIKTAANSMEFVAV